MLSNRGTERVEWTHVNLMLKKRQEEEWMQIFAIHRTLSFIFIPGKIIELISMGWFEIFKKVIDSIFQTKSNYQIYWRNNRGISFKNQDQNQHDYYWGRGWHKFSTLHIFMKGNLAPQKEEIAYRGVLEFKTKKWLVSPDLISIEVTDMQSKPLRYL